MIATDLDEVLCNTFPVLRDRCLSKFKYDIKNITSYDITIPNVDRWQVMEFFINVLGREHLNIKPFDDTEYFLREAYKISGKRITIVTARQEAVKWQTVDWIEWNLPNDIPYELIINTEKKSDFFKDKEYKYFVDDRYDNVQDVSSVVPYVFLLNKPWNQSKIVNQNIIRVDNLTQTINIIKEIENGRNAFDKR